MAKILVKNKKDNLKPLVVILGPTGAGKSELAIQLAKKFDGEIISADSRQIYKGMDIGTGKIKNKISNNKNFSFSPRGRPGRKTDLKTSSLIVEGIRHHLIDRVEPDEDYSVGEYKREALEIIKGIHQGQKIPFLVGGTGLYIQAVVDNLTIPSLPPQKKLRRELEGIIKDKGLEELWQKLIELDPQAAEQVQKENPRRVIRALEVCLTLGRPFTSLRSFGTSLFRVLEIGLEIPREELYRKIDKRVERMLEEGLIEEVKKLSKKYDFTLPSLSGIGYSEVGEYLRGEISKEEMIQKIKFHTHRYARSQLSWFRRDQRIRWVKNQKEAEKLVSKFLAP